MRDTTSKYVSPNYEIDSPIFFSDISLDNLETEKKYLELISDQKYTEASTLLNENTYDSQIYHQADFAGAWIFNLLENRLYAIETYFKNGVRKKPDLVAYNNTEPTGKSNGYCWVSDN